MTEETTGTTRKRRIADRLPHYDYSTPGYYFVTVCIQNRLCFLGRVVGAGPCAGPSMELNGIGKMVEGIWREMPLFYPNVRIDEYALMPNHFHGIVILTNKRESDNSGRPQGAAPTLSLPDVVHRFKSLTTARYREGIKKYGWERYPGRFWQRGYHDRVIRNEQDLYEIRK